MALIFDRPEFSSGIMIIKESVEVTDKDGNKKNVIKEMVFTPNDKGKSFEFSDESKILENYSLYFKDCIIITW